MKIYRIFGRPCFARFGGYFYWVGRETAGPYCPEYELHTFSRKLRRIPTRRST